jgi:hypothetical protein
MNKKICIIFILSLLLLPLILNFSQSENQDIFGISSDSGVKLTQKWEYLGKEWKNIILRNPIVQSIDSFFQKMNPVFLVLFGVNYSLSLTLFLIVFFWMCLFFLIFNVLKYTIFSKGVALLISLGIAIGAAQIKLFQMPVNFFIGLFFGEKSWWVKLLIGAGVLIGIVIAVVLVKKFGKKFAESKKRMKEEEHRLKLEIGAKVGEELYKAAGK